jgi:predicted nucleic-acid-binding Zn-ribbon protein
LTANQPTNQPNHVLKQERKKERKKYMRAYCQKWYAKNKERQLAYMRGYFHRQKVEVLSHYSATVTCQRCGFSDVRALSVDHVNGGGRRHIKEIQRSGSSFYHWLKQHKYPPGFQVLCMNCQWIKRSEKHEVRGGIR